MVICTYFLSGNCRFGSKCNNDHIDLASIIKLEVDATLKGNQWPLSCFGPFKERNCIPNFIEDCSFEEIRMMFLEAKAQNNLPGHAVQLGQMINGAKQKMQWLASMNRDIMNTLIEIYNQPEDSSKPAAASGNAFSTSTAASIFGGGSSAATSGFGSTGSTFGGLQSSANTTGNIFGAAPNQNAASIFGGNSTVSTSVLGGSSNIFAKVAQPGTGTNIFGQASFGQPQQQQPAQPTTNSIFGGPAVFGGSGTSLFATAGQPPSGGSIFGGSSTETSSTTNLFAQPFTAQQPLQNQNVFQSQQTSTSPFLAGPIPAANNNVFGAVSTFGATTGIVQQPQSNPFTTNFNTQQPASQSLFGSVQPPGQPQTTQNLFLPAPAPVNSATPFGGGSNSIFPAAPSTTTVASSAVVLSAAVYSRMEDLTEEQLEAFKADHFELGKIPTVPPPRELCG
ncbi:nuclear pore complex protein Nup98-Nup96-like [Uranotaenia lowii]|uniref:nuclear pore complex protein Nup98-Nup96-like n=1 Tax=Uranotaenia lowii TaxID=190385 RepID=UPI00247AC4C4|nr:nuclear pore complex protein Nup98-Nup96-like [Uranotaenia lowii]